jgi:hypothetical protein
VREVYPHSLTFPRATIHTLTPLSGQSAEASGVTGLPQRPNVV